MSKKELSIFATCLMVWCVSLMSQAQQMCGFDQMHKFKMQSDPAYSAQINALDAQVLNIVQNQGAANKLATQVYTIPVVVHVIHVGEPLGTGSNVTDASIQNMIASLNSSFANANGNGVDIQIQFCLASRDPNGNATTGIRRVDGNVYAGYNPNGVYSYPGCGGISDAPIKAANGWNKDYYYNIYIVINICGASGYAELPYNSGTKDGMVINYSAIGNAPEVAHETGHWLGLLHTYTGQSGFNCPPNANCNIDGDKVCDTPPILNSECGNTSTCVGGVITNSTSNYMSTCFNTWDRFTQGQKERMRGFMTCYPRANLLSSLGCIPLASNDAGVEYILNPMQTSYAANCTGNGTITPIVNLKNYGTNSITSASIKYKIDNGTLNTYSWAGTLTAGQNVNITLPDFTASLGAHTFLAYSILPNAVADGNGNNDSGSVNFNYVSATIINATATGTSTICSGSNSGSATVSTTSKLEIKEDFEGVTDWILANDFNDNERWYVGTATANGGSKSMYISNDFGVSNNFNPNSGYSTAHFYKDFYFPAGATNITFKFDWKCGTGTGSYDNLKLFMATPDVLPIGYNSLDNVAQELGTYFGSGSFNTATISNITAAGSVKRFVFTFDNRVGLSTNQPPPSVDNIIVSYTPASGGTYSYSWNTIPVQTNATATGLLPGTYTVTATHSTGCTGTANITINSSPAITLTTSQVNIPCGNGNVGTITANASGGTPSFSYLWSNAQITATATGLAVGTYTVTVTDGAGCTITASATITTNCTVSISAGGPTTFCFGGNVVLTSSLATGNLWSNGATTQSITASTSGSYSCTNNGNTSNSIAVTVNPIPATPTISNSGATTFCTGGSVTLTSSSATGNTWTPGGATTQSINVTSSGSYTVKVTSNGCTSSPSIAKVVTVNPIPSTPTITAGGPTTFCTGGSVTLTSSSATGNTWTPGGATTQSINVTSSGSYTVAVTSNGCTSLPSVATVVTVQACSISISAGGPTTFCQGGNVVLTSSQATGNLWSNGATTQNITVTSSGSYSCTNGGNTSNTIVVTVNPIPATPTISAGGPTTFCTGGSVTLTSSSATGNTWTPGGATTQNINVTTSGSYTVKVTSNGCTSSPSAATVVTVQTCGSVSITAGGPTTFCSGGNVVLTSSIATGNVWSNGATAQSITVTTSGNYSCTNGGNTSNTISVTVNASPSTTTSQTGTVSLCSGSLINGPITGNAASLDGVDDYITIANPVSSATAFTFEAWIYPKANTSWMRVFDFGNSPGVNMFLAAPSFSGYPRFAINIGSGEQIVESNTALSINTWQHIAVTLSGTTARIYIGGLLTGTNAAFTYNPASLGATVNNWIGQSQYPDPTFNGYIDEVRFWNTSRTQTQLQANMNKTIGVTTSGLVAYYRLDESTGTSVLELVSGTSTSTANNGATWQVPSTVPFNPSGYLWSTGASTQGINVTAAGTYTVSVTAASGCTATSAPVVVSSIKPVTAATITASGPTTFCTGGSVTLTAPSRGNALQFDGVDDYAAAATPMIPTTGNYSILFWAKESLNQTGYREIISQGRKFYIGRDNTGIIRIGDDWTNTGVNWPTDLLWHHYAVTRNSFNTFLYIDGNLVATKGSAIGSPIVVNGTPNLFMVGSQFSGVCCENFNGQVDDVTIWNSVRTITQIKAAMNSTVSTASIGLVAYYKLDEGAGLSVLNAVNSSNAVTLNNGPTWVVPSSLPYNINSYLWSTTATTQSITAITAATYKVTVTNNSGCTSTSTKKVVISNPSASFTANGPLTFCNGGSVTFTANSGTGFTYKWKNGASYINNATSQTYVATTAGIYRVEITNSVGCSKLSGSKTVTINCREEHNTNGFDGLNLTVEPNPAQNYINLIFDSEYENASISILNISGQQLYNKNMQTDNGAIEDVLDISFLPPAVYIVRVSTGDVTNYARFVKQ
ncbi:MAG TPA: M43 family zinc metalloprotease [Bacteroidia bacterium]|nr:M43 family zinc metalloprotease [Bacteroidia bacterium]